MEEAKKFCSKCGEEKLLETEFSKHAGHADGRQSYCKVCEAKDRKTYRENPDTRPKALLSLRKSQCKRLYGISLEEKEQMFGAQGSICASCGSTESGGQWCLDHDHVTDEIRGVVCRPCNLILGFAQDSIEHLNKVAAYLRARLKTKEAAA